MKGLTPYQSEVLIRLNQIEIRTKAYGDLDQVLESLSWKPTKESTQFIIRAVISKGFVKKTALEQRRGRNRVCFSITEKGKEVLDPRSSFRDLDTDFVPGIPVF